MLLRQASRLAAFPLAAPLHSHIWAEASLPRHPSPARLSPNGRPFFVPGHRTSRHHPRQSGVHACLGQFGAVVAEAVGEKRASDSVFAAEIAIIPSAVL